MTTQAHRTLEQTMASGDAWTRMSVLLVFAVLVLGAVLVADVWPPPVLEQGQPMGL